MPKTSYSDHTKFKALNFQFCTPERSALSHAAAVKHYTILQVCWCSSPTNPQNREQQVVGKFSNTKLQVLVVGNMSYASFVRLLVKKPTRAERAGLPFSMAAER